jgi:hypothetical protein
MSFSNQEFRDLSDKKLQRLDQKALRILNSLVDNDIPRGKTLEILLNIRERLETRGFLVEAERAFIKKVDKDFDDYPFNHELCTRLAKGLEDGRTPDQAENFLRSTIEQFNEKHWLSDLQREQMIRIAGALEKEDEEIV